jgi:hypothetical protein
MVLSFFCEGILYFHWLNCYFALQDEANYYIIQTEINALSTFEEEQFTAFKTNAFEL